MEDATPKLVVFDHTARQALAVGVDTLANAVKVTLGPNGQTVAIERRDATPILTKDGVTVAKAVNLKDPLANLGVQLVKEAASRTAEVAGDGTTSATVLAQAMFTDGLKLVAAGASAKSLKKGMEIALQLVLEELKNSALPASGPDVLSQVATISANGEKEVGQLLADAFDRVGVNGVLTVEEAKGYKSSLEVVEGMQIERGFLSSYFITHPERMVCELQAPLVLLANVKIQSMKDVLPFLETVHGLQRPLLIAADEVEGDAMQALVINKLKEVLSVCAIKAPGFGDTRMDCLGDLAALLGADVVTDVADLKSTQFDVARLGSCKRVLVTRHGTTFISETADSAKVQSRMTLLESRLEDVTLSEDERLFVKTRLAKLSGGVAVLRVGGLTEVELRERKDRVDDALNATQAALAEGIVPGGGVALVRAAAVLKSLKLRGDELMGADIIRRACDAPLRQIVVNSGRSADIVVAKVRRSKSPGFGYDARNDVYGDMLLSGIVDPVRVVRSALQNACSVAAAMLTVGCILVEQR